MRLRYLLPVATLFLLCSFSLNAQLAVGHVVTGKSPAAVFADSNFVHVLSIGIDRNFNGLFEPDSGDVSAQWFVLNLDGTIRDSVTFHGFFNDFPVRVGVDHTNRLLYMAQLGRVRAFNLDTRMVAQDTVVAGKYSGVSFDSAEGDLLLHMRPGFNSPGELVRYNIASADTIAQIQTGISPQMSVVRVPDNPNGMQEIYTLNEGEFGKPNSTIGFHAYSPDIFKAVNGKSLGGDANDMIADSNYLYVLLSGTHEIKAINLSTNKEASQFHISTGTSGFDGPRAIALQGDSLVLVTTYAGDLRRFYHDGRLLDSIKLPGKAEGVVVNGNHAFVAIKYALGGSGYDLDSLVAVVDLVTGKVTDTIHTLLDPTTLFVDKHGDLQVFGYGLADSLHWWTTYDGTTYAVKSSHTFTGTLGFPLRIAYDAAADSLFICVNGQVRQYSALNNGNFVSYYSDSTIAGDLTNVTLAPGYLLVTELPKNFGTGPGYLNILPRNNGVLLNYKPVARIQTGSFLTKVSAARPSREPASRISAFYGLNEGSFGSANASLSYFEFQADILGPDTVGSGGNHLLVSNLSGRGRGGQNAFFVTATGNHSVVEIDSAWHVITRHLTNTTGYDGPRETVEAWGALNDGIFEKATSTYAGQIELDFRETGYNTYGRAEGLVMMPGQELFVANVSRPDYSADSNTVIFTIPAAIQRGNSIESGSSLSQNTPNPTTNETSIAFSVQHAGRVSIDLYSVHGQFIRTLVEKNVEPGSYTARVHVGDLPAGNYIYRLEANGATASKLMQVVR